MKMEAVQLSRRPFILDLQYHFSFSSSLEKPSFLIRFQSKRNGYLVLELSNTIATVITVQLVIINIVVYKLRELHELNFSEKFDGLCFLPLETICRQFSIGEILLATNNFDDSLVICRGGFGKVYKGSVDNGATIVAIKRLGSRSKQGANEFRAEITMLSKFRHSNIVSLIGYCETNNEMILVYEYILHGTIADHLYKIRESGGNHVHLGWVQRLKICIICIGAARGLDYLHSGTGINERVIHRDIKTSNILLDENLAARISDFGLSRIGPANRSFTHVSTNVKGHQPQISSVCPANDCYRCFGSNQPLNSISRPWKWLIAFGAVNTIATLITIILALFNILVYKLIELQDSNSGEKADASSLLPSDNKCRQFSLGEILLATNHFDDSLVIGWGGFGKVYKGVIDNGESVVAIKRLGYMSKQGAVEFRAEITMLAKFRHCNIVALIGYCATYNEMILVYEYMVHGTLSDHLYKFRKNGSSNMPLSWRQRLKICIGAAAGLNYLHTGVGIKHRVIHRDIKSSNILLDENWAARISDFGLSRLGPANQSFTHVSTNLKGTFGYMDPDYFFTHRLTRKSDVYSFGVVLFVVLCGRPALDPHLDPSQRGLAQWAQNCVKEGIIETIVDPNVRWGIFPESLSVFVSIAEKCLHSSPKERPTMSEVVAELECSLAAQERRVDSLSEESIFDVGEAFESQEIVDFSMEQNAVDIVELSVTKDVVFTNVDSGEHQDKKVGKSYENKRKNFAKKFRTFFSGTTSRISGNNAGSLAAIGPNDEVAASTGIDSTVDLLNDKKFVNVQPIWLEPEQTDDIIREFLQHAGQNSRVKFLSSNYLTEKEFKEKVTMLTMLKHVNVDELRGCFVDHDSCCCLIYEPTQIGSLHDVLHCEKVAENVQPGLLLSWSQRAKIAIGVAKGLAYLLEKEYSPVTKYGITSCKVVLFEDCDVAKIEVMDMWNEAREFPAHIAHIQDHMGSGYCAPEIVIDENIRDFGVPIGEFRNSLWLSRLLSKESNSKSDIYSFGVVLLELLTGRKPIDHTQPFGEERLVKWATPIISKDNVKLWIDPKLNGYYSPREALEIAAIASSCVQYDAASRPSISYVVERLEKLRT